MTYVKLFQAKHRQFWLAPPLFNTLTMQYRWPDRSIFLQTCIGLCIVSAEIINFTPEHLARVRFDFHIIMPTLCLQLECCIASTSREQRNGWKVPPRFGTSPPLLCWPEMNLTPTRYLGLWCWSCPVRDDQQEKMASSESSGLLPPSSSSVRR